MNGGRRPIEDYEVPHLEALGVELQALRLDADLTLKAAGERAELSPGHLSALERALRRTRRSTLERIVAALVVDEQRRPEVVEHLVEVAGPGLASESQYADRVARRRARRARQHRAATAMALRKIESDVRKISPASPFSARAHRIASKAREQLAGLDAEEHAASPADLVPPAVAEHVRTEGLQPDQREAFERQARLGPNREIATALIALDDERLSS